MNFRFDFVYLFISKQFNMAVYILVVMWNLVSVLCDKCDLIISDKDKLLLHKTACLLTVKLVSPGRLRGAGVQFNR